MRTLRTLLIPCLALTALAVCALAGGSLGWHAKPADAVKKAKASGKPILVVTCWADGI